MYELVEWCTRICIQLCLVVRRYGTMMCHGCSDVVAHWHHVLRLLSPVKYKLSCHRVILTTLEL